MAGAKRGQPDELNIRVAALSDLAPAPAGYEYINCVQRMWNQSITEKHVYVEYMCHTHRVSTF